MKAFRRLLSLIVATGIAFGASAADFFDTSTPSQMLTFGARLGINTANRTIGSKVFNTYAHNSWGTGFDAGIVADINFKNYLSVQPGFFFQVRTGNYTYINDRDLVNHSYITQWGHYAYCDFLIPVVGSVHLNIADNVRWNIDFGPYVQFNLNGDGSNMFYTGIDPGNYIQAKPAGVDFGFKMGTGIDILKHYYFGIHYLAGCLSPWKNVAGGCNKAWSFTIGYNL